MYAPQHWTSEFICCAYIRLDRPNVVLIQYLCDETKAAQFPHGNSTRNTRAYIHTQPSVLASVRNVGASGTASAQHMYQNLVVAGSSSSAPVTGVLRNTEQIRNTLKRQCNSSCLSRDALYNIHELAYDFPFIHHITTVYTRV